MDATANSHTDAAPAPKTQASVRAVRPTKKQRALLDFIEKFITEHGYSPSYREIMNGCNYNSIATVAVHINNLISRGHLRKRDHSARSLELAKPTSVGATLSDDDPAALPESHGENWLAGKVDALLERLQTDADTYDPEDLQAIVTAFELLGLHTSADQFAERLAALDN